MNEIVGEGSKISWGKVLAGAAIATGAVLFGGIMIEQLPETIGVALKAIGTKIAEWAGSITAAKAPEISAATVEIVKKVVGAGLIGGGVAYLMGGKSAQAYEPAYAAASDESFTMKEDMRRMQGLMVARAAAAGNPQAQAMLSQQMGRA
ncbi:MAG: hypothetical protein KGI29_01455 [Pseudomonadota bacterium]|nr:hypothetical protein [Pseudomonadota bacterium]MDE3038139.1 hypothetical protein [Pseudomonadota bacterium]